MKTITIEGTLRKEFGKAAARELKKTGDVPCVIYGGKENISFSAPARVFKDLIYTSEFKTANIKVDGKEFVCVYKELQFDPVNDKLKHIDFIELVPGKKLTLEIPIKLAGTPKGVVEGGKLFQKVRKLKVLIPADKLVGQFDVDVTHLALGKSIRVAELKLDNVEVITAPNIPIASVFVPRVVVETPAATAPTAAAPAAGTPGAAPAAAGAAAPAAGAAKPAEEKKK